MREAMAVLGLLLVCGVVRAQEGALKVGQPAPDFALPDLQGKYVKLSYGYGERVTVVGLSGLRTAACRDMMRELQRLQGQYRGDRVGVLLVNLDGLEARPLARAAVRQLGLTYPILTDEGFVPLPAAYRVKTLPHVLVVDQDGTIRFSRAGSGTASAAALRACVEQVRPPKLPRLLDLEGLGCATCKPMPPLLRALQQQLGGKVRIDVREFDPDYVEQFGLEAMPTQIFYDAAGREVYRHGGLMTADEVLEQFRRLGVVPG